jgi:hypothetical protein
MSGTKENQPVFIKLSEYIVSFPKTSISIACGFIILFVFLRGCFIVATDRQEKYVNLAFLGFGLVLGWIAGAFISPVTSAEGKIFDQYGAAVASFGTGYLLAKTDKLVTYVFDPDRYKTNVNIFRSVSVAVAFLVTMAVIFIVRTNASPIHNEGSPTARNLLRLDAAGVSRSNDQDPR